MGILSFATVPVNSAATDFDFEAAPPTRDDQLWNTGYELGRDGTPNAEPPDSLTEWQQQTWEAGYVAGAAEFDLEVWADLRTMEDRWEAEIRWQAEEPDWNFGECVEVEGHRAFGA